MQRTIGIITTVAFLVACGPRSSETTKPDDVEILHEQHLSDQGFEADVLVTKAVDGSVSSKATVKDPASGDTVELWTDGTTVRWSGTVQGEPVSGSAPVADMIDSGGPKPACLHPVAAIICIGAGLVLLTGCAFGFSCDGGPPPPPTVPPGSGHGEGGGGDGEDSSDDDE